MHDLKRIRHDFETVYQGVMKRGKGDFGLLRIQELEVKRREILQDLEAKKNQSNVKSRQVPVLKKAGQDATELLAELKTLSGEIGTLEAEVKAVEDEVTQLLYLVPNVPHDDIPVGQGEDDNVELRRWGEPRVFDFEPKPHWDVGTERDWLDFDRGAKVAGSRFTFIKKELAQLERALMNYYLDFHDGSYTEINAPALANRAAMTGTGQLPKFEDDMYHITEDDLFLIPTAEVTLTNLHREEILDQADLPIYLTGYTPCFRREAGSAGRDTRGIIRQHQFGKVELVKLSTPETSDQEHRDMVAHVEKMIQSLEIPYRVIELCGADLGFSAAKTFDIELWFPSAKTYREISSLSNFTDFQARRASIRYRNEAGKVEYVHTLNGSGLPTGRMLAAILENNQTEDGKVIVPEVLRPYMRGRDEI